MPASALPLSIASVPVSQLHERLGAPRPCEPNPASRDKRLCDWRMEEDDAPIFRWLYREHRPCRHLEFGTWQGQGTLYVLEESDATVWTINLPDGERTPDGDWTYYVDFDADAALPSWGERRTTRRGRILAQTDAGGFIGRLYREAGLAHRVCQIYCDSRAWDTAAYPRGFFDSVLIDGGHTADVVQSDTRQALPLVRPGGLVLWHDFCPDAAAQAQCASTHGPRDAIAAMGDELRIKLDDLFWIDPSWILVGVKR